MPYIRFVIPYRDEDSGRSQGVFQAAYDLLDTGDLSPGEWAAIREALDWFKRHLPAPKDVDPRAVFWFDAAAGESTRRIWTLVNLLREQGLLTQMVKTNKPGTIVHRDQFQIAAIPGPSTPR